MNSLSGRLARILFLVLIVVFLFGSVYHNGLRMHCPFCLSGVSAVKVIIEESIGIVDNDSIFVFEDERADITSYVLAKDCLSRAPPLYILI